MAKKKQLKKAKFWLDETIEVRTERITVLDGIDTLTVPLDYMKSLEVEPHEGGWYQFAVRRQVYGENGQRFDERIKQDENGNDVVLFTRPIKSLCAEKETK